MNAPGRYEPTGVESEFEPGSRGRVLKNKLGIKRVREMGELETEYLYRTLYQLQDVYDKNYRFTSEDIRRMHARWLEEIYEWAGQYRNVNVSKGEFQFATAMYVPRLMNEFEKVLETYSPCVFESEEEVIDALSVVHAELVLIHPFREGNGRVARMLASLMAYQADYPTLDFSQIKGAKKKEYINAVQLAMDSNYDPMKKIFRSVIKRSIKTHREQEELLGLSF
jgi:cell filamentation protein